MADKEEKKAEEPAKPESQNSADASSLETKTDGEKAPANNMESAGTLDSDTAHAADEAEAAAKAAAPEKKQKKGNIFARLLSHLNIYMLAFLLILILAGGVTFIAMQTNKKAEDQKKAAAQLGKDQLAALQDSATKIGDPKQVLNVESNTIFSGKVLVRDSLDVAGSINVGGALALPGITVNGPSNFDQIVANNLQTTANASVGGQLTVQKGLNVTGAAVFTGSITASQINIDHLQITGDLILSRHIDAGGASPSKVSGGGALGSGGTSSVSGTDTAGTITINTGSGTTTGCFITITFAQKFSATPHVVVTPVGLGAAALNYYIDNRTTNGFQLCTASLPPTGTTFSFDFVAID